MNLLLIYNPASGFGRAKKKLSQIISLCKQKAMVCDLRLTCHRGYAIEMAKEADFEMYGGVVAAGGDGTLFEVARITKLAHRLKLLGNFSYTFSTILQMLFLKSYILNIEIDGEIFERENIFVEISNTRYTSNFLIAPDAKNDDGLLDVILLGKCARRRLLRNFPKIFTGEHTTLDEIELFQAKNIRITTNNSQYLTPDGELLGKTPVEIECLPQAIEVFWRWLFQK